MDPNGKQRSIVPAKFLHWLTAEAELWKQESLISEEQRAQILGRYSASESARREEDRRSSKFIAVISVLGSILLGLGVILFFAHNWKYIAVPVKLGIILGLIAAAYTLGYWLTYVRKKYIGAGKALILLGVLFFGAGIWLVAQIFNINAHYPDGMLYWAAGGIAVALATRLKPVIALSAVLLTLWTVFEQSGFQQPNYLFILLMLAVLFPLIYMEKSELGLVLATVGVAIWFGIYSILWQFSVARDPKFVYLMGALLVFFIFVYGYSRLQTVIFKTPGFEPALRVLGILGVFAALYAFTFRGMEASARTAFPDSLPSMDVFITYALLLAGSIAAMFVNFRKNRHGKLPVYESAALLFILLLLLFSLLAPSSAETGLYIYTLLFNIVFLVFVIALLALGFRERKAIFVNLALGFFVLDVVTRYFDYLWKLLPRSIFFIAGGLILLIGGMLLEKRRRKIVDTWSEV